MTLDPRHLNQLKASGIADDIIQARGYESITPGSIHDWRELTGKEPKIHSDKLLKTILHRGALAFPLYRCGEPDPFTWILRPDLPRKKDSKPVKYEYPYRVENIFDVLPSYREALSDQNTPLWITEGVKKADSLASAYGSGIVPLNENGVFGFRTKGKPLPDIDRIAWESRRVIIAPDADARSNPQVRNATNRLARFLISKGAGEVLLLLLPRNDEMPTMGVDDYLGQGHTTGKLESYLVTLEELSTQATITLMRHPDTGAELRLPKGYEKQGDTIMRSTANDMTIEVYRGKLAVVETGYNLETNMQTMTALFSSRGSDQRVTAPRSAFAQARHCTPLLSDYGAAVYDGNGREVTRYLTQFVNENEQTIPHKANSERWGLVSDGLVLPGGCVGFADEVSYTGPSPIKIGTDHDAYPQALREILNVWEEDTITSLIIALSLAAPVIARQQPRRNPAIYLHGGSNSGKTTLIQFATGVWGDPMQRPIRLEGSSSTRVSILQTLTQLSGLPLFIDEVHTTLHPADVESTVYNFANGQARSTGGVNGTPNGGGTLHGALFLAGEALTEFKYAGSANRTLMVSADMYWPLCAAKETREGQRRAEMLEHAWKVGAGTFGPRVAESIWCDWTAFTRRVAELRTDPAVIHLPAWSDSLAIAAALLEVISLQIELDAYEYTEQALQTWAELLLAGRVEHDPAADAFDQVKLLIAQGEQFALNNTNTPTPLYHPTPEGDWEQVPWAVWETRSIGRQIVAYRKVNEHEWRVPTSTLQFKERVGEQSVQLHGRLWVHKGWVEPDKYGKATQIKKIPGGGAMRCIIVPDALIQGEGESEGRAA